MERGAILGIVPTEAVPFGGLWRDFMDILRQQLRGASHHTLDDKFRIIIPKRLTGVLGEDAEMFFLTAHPDGCLLLMDRRVFEKLSQNMVGEDLLEEETRGRDLRRVLLGHAEEARPDKTGRVLLPESLRGFLGLQEGQREVVAVGAGTWIEIWHPDTWTKRLSGVLSGSLSTERANQAAV